MKKSLWALALPIGTAVVMLWTVTAPAADVMMDTAAFASAVPVEGEIPGLLKWANSQPSDSAQLTIVSPRNGARFATGESLYVNVTVSGMALGEQTQHAAGCGLANSAEGQHVHVIVNNEPYQANYADGKPFPIGMLPPGVHTLRVFPSRSWHESVKSPGAFQWLTFYVGDTAGPGPIKTGQPLLTYSRPKGVYEGEAAKTIMVDFYLTNVELAPKGYRVRLTVDGKSSLLDWWVPYLVTGLSPGKHRFKLELLDTSGNIVPGAYNVTERTITLK
ncbi:MAG: hypothetical protein AB1792_02520 [Candidatus Zixiibacteriota bacterium]